MLVARVSLVVALLFVASWPVATAQARQARPGIFGWHSPYGSVLDDAATVALGKEGLAALYGGRLDEAARIFARLKTKHPGHPIGPFLEGLVIWWQILPDLTEDDRTHDAAFTAAMERTIRAADALKKTGRHPFDVGFFKAAALGFRGRLLSNRGAWFRAARDGREAMDLVFKVAERDTLNPDFTFGRSVYDFFAAAIPAQYPVVKPLMLFFPDGNRARGLAGLERSANLAQFVATEALYFQLQIHFQYEPDYRQSLFAIRQLRDRHPENGFFHVLEGRVFTRWGMWAEALPVLDEVIRSADGGQPGYTTGILNQALYFRGRALVSLSRPDEALATLARLDALTAGQDPETYFRVWGRLRIGMIHDVAGRRTEAVAAYRAVLNMEDRAEAHDRARRYLKTPFGS